LGHKRQQTPLKFVIGGQDKAILDGSGNLLVGTTQTATQLAATSSEEGMAIDNGGLVAIANSGQSPLVLNRLSSDGNIINFHKDGGSPVGSIGAYLGSPYIGTGDTGLLFETTNNRIEPFDTSALGAEDAAIDLGQQFNRFQDLYLSGGVYLGGTGSANKLDDYEEGSWTPTFLGSSTDPTVTYGTRHATYTKVGRLVTLFFDMTISSYSGGSGTVKVGGLPVAQSGNARGVGLTVGSTGVTHTQALSAQAIGSALFINESGIGDLPVSDVSTSGWRIIAECSYTAA
jgi:hypothetical protein